MVDETFVCVPPNCVGVAPKEQENVFTTNSGETSGFGAVAAVPSIPCKVTHRKKEKTLINEY